VRGFAAVARVAILVLATVTVFDDPRVRVEDLAATPVEGGIEIAVEGRLVEGSELPDG
jgi:hypothetical protein